MGVTSWLRGSGSGDEGDAELRAEVAKARKKAAEQRLKQERDPWMRRQYEKDVREAEEKIRENGEGGT